MNILITSAYIYLFEYKPECLNGAKDIPYQLFPTVLCQSSLSWMIGKGQEQIKVNIYIWRIAQPSFVLARMDVSNVSKSYDW